MLLIRVCRRKLSFLIKRPKVSYQKVLTSEYRLFLVQLLNIVYVAVSVIMNNEGNRNKF